MRVHRSRISFALVVMLVLSATALAQSMTDRQGHGRGSGDHGMAFADAHADREAEKWMKAEGKGKRDAGLARAESHKLFAKFAYDERANSARGAWVRLNLSPMTGAVSDYWAKSTNGTVFDSLTMTPRGASDVAVHGAVLRARGEDHRLSVHNNPLAMLKLGVGNATDVEVALPADASGATAYKNSTRHARVDYAGGGHAHFLVAGRGNLSIGADNRSIVATLANNSAFIVAVHPTESIFQATVHPELEALSEGTLGGTLTIVDVEGEPVEEGESFGVDLRTISIGNKTVNVNASSKESHGRAIILRIDPDAVGENVTVMVNGTRATMSADFDEVLSASSGEARAAVTRTTEGVVVAVYIPHFSWQVVSVASVPADENGGATSPTNTSPPAGDGGPEPGPEATPGPGAVALIAAIGIALVILRRR